MHPPLHGGAIKPITFGGKLYLSYLFVVATKDFGKKVELLRNRTGSDWSTLYD